MADKADKKDQHRTDGRAPLALRVGHEEVVVRRRYELLSTINDLMIGIWFAVGSILFFSQSTTETGTWLFLIGSVQLLIRPGIRLSRNLHLNRVSDPGGRWLGGDQDF